MVHPADFPKALYVSQGILFVAYVAVGATVYATVGAADWLTSPLSLSLSPSTSRAMAVTVHSLVILHVTYVEGACHGGRKTGVCCGAGFREHVARICGSFGGLRGIPLFSKSGIEGGSDVVYGVQWKLVVVEIGGPRRCLLEVTNTERSSYCITATALSLSAAPHDSSMCGFSSACRPSLQF